MKPIQIVLPESLLKRIDSQCGPRNRSSFFRELAEAWLKQQKIKKLEQKQIDGYAKYPVKPGEFDTWYSEQVWPE